MGGDIDNNETIIDYVTGQPLPNVGAEVVRQYMEKFLVEKLGYAPSEIEVNFPMCVTIGDETYRSRVDLVVRIDNRFIMAIKCAAGSLGSRVREVLAAARLMIEYQVPIAVVSDSKTAIVVDTVSGKEIGNGLHAIPNRQDAVNRISAGDFIPYEASRREREAIIFRSYDSMNVNIAIDDGDGV